MNKRKSLPYGYQDIQQDDVDAVSRALTGDFLTTGPLVESFENELTKLTKAKFAVSCSSGTSALHLACMLRLKQELGTAPSVTFLATANAVRYCNADVLFVMLIDTGLADRYTMCTIIKGKERVSKSQLLLQHLTGPRRTA